MYFFGKFLMLHYYKTCKNSILLLSWIKFAENKEKYGRQIGLVVKIMKQKKKNFWVGGLLSGIAQNMQSVNFGDQNWFAQWKREVSIKQEEVKRVKGDAGQGNMKFRHYIT